MRLFFAAWPDAETRESLRAAGGALELDEGSRRVPAENYHLTLAFIGEVPAARVAAMRYIGESQRGAQATLRFDGYEYWPKAQVVVAAASECPVPLEALCRSLHAGLAQHGVALDPKPFGRM